MRLEPRADRCSPGRGLAADVALPDVLPSGSSISLVCAVTGQTLTFPVKGRVELRELGASGVGPSERVAVTWVRRRREESASTPGEPEFTLQRFNSMFYATAVAPTLVTRGRLMCDSADPGPMTRFTAVVHGGGDARFAHAVVSLRTNDGRWLAMRPPHYINCSATSLNTAAAFRIQLRTCDSDEPMPSAYCPLERCLGAAVGAEAAARAEEDAATPSKGGRSAAARDSTDRCGCGPLMLRDKTSRSWIERWFDVVEAAEQEPGSAKSLLSVPRLVYRETGTPTAPVITQIPLWTTPPVVPNSPPIVREVNADHALFSKLASATCHVLEIELKWYFYSPIYVAAYTRAKRDAWKRQIEDVTCAFAVEVALAAANAALASAVTNKTMAFTCVSNAERFDRLETERLRRPWCDIERVAVITAPGAIAAEASATEAAARPPSSTLQLGTVLRRETVSYPPTIAEQQAASGGSGAGADLEESSVAHEYVTVEFDRWPLCGKPPSLPTRMSSSTAVLDAASLALEMADDDTDVASTPTTSYTAPAFTNCARAHVPAENAPAVLEGTLEKRLNSTAKQAFVGMSEWSLKHVVLCESERTLAYFNTTSEERYYDKKMGSRTATPKHIFSIDGSATVRLDGDVASLASLARAKRRKRAVGASSSTAASLSSPARNANRGFHAFVLTTSQTKLLDGGQAGAEVFFAASTRGEREMWVRALERTIETARVEEKKEHAKRWLVDGQPTRRPTTLSLMRPSTLLSSAGVANVGGQVIGYSALGSSLAALRESGDPATRPVFVLSIDGGGVKGLIPALLLHELEQRTGYKTHELFDVIGGTSTGGLIAFGLGLKELPMSEIIALYTTRADEIFPTPEQRLHEAAMAKIEGTRFGGSQLVSTTLATGAKWLRKQRVEEGSSLIASVVKGVNAAYGGAQYEATGIEQLSQEMLGGDEVRLADYAAHSPKCFVVAVEATDTAHPNACIFSSYSVSKASARFPGARHVRRVTEAPLWVAARATSAAPTFFPPCIYTGRTFIDGGLLNNNPSDHAVAEAKRLFPHRPIVLISLGCGEEEPTLFQTGDGNNGLTNTTAKWRSSEAHVSSSRDSTPTGTPRSSRRSGGGDDRDEIFVSDDEEDCGEGPSLPPRPHVTTQTRVWGEGAEVEAKLNGKSCWFDATVVRFSLVDGSPQVSEDTRARCVVSQRHAVASSLTLPLSPSHFAV